MYSYTSVAIAHAEPLLVTSLKWKTLWETKASFCQYIFSRLPCFL